MSLPRPVLRACPDAGPLRDRFGRAHSYLRVSVTDRCNLRCTYCMPEDGVDWMRRDDLLSYEELRRLVGLFVQLGIERVRLTGGEPTVRRDLDRLVGYLSVLPGLREVSLTTNGVLLAQRAEGLAAAGLSRINLSLDTVDAEVFRALTRGGDLSRVLRAVSRARQLGLTPIKINAVVMRGVNDAGVIEMVEHFMPHSSTTIVRFIEYMPFSGNKGPRLHVPSALTRARIEARFGKLRPDEDVVGAGPAVQWVLPGSGLRVAFISPMTGHFCEACNRLRLQADGHLRTCLSRDDTPSLLALLRGGADDLALEAAIRAMVWGKVAGHEAHESGVFEGVMTQVGG